MYGVLYNASRFPLEILDDAKKEPESFTEDVTIVLKEGHLEPV